VEACGINEMRKSAVDYKGKYYELRRNAKELIFENSAYQAEILECQKMVNMFRTVHTKLRFCSVRKW
jgi:uncharacterized coiled-coil DUF342 family protein